MDLGNQSGGWSKGNPTFSVSEHHLENRYFSIRLNSKGQFAGILDKTAGRELFMPGKAGNVIMSYEDRPHNYDAWDINNYYEEKSWEVDQVECIEVTEHGPVRACVTVTRRYLDSTIKQSIYLYHDIPRIDIRNQIEWKEHQIFLKTLFPLDIHTSEAVFDIQYGNVKRPTHANTSWDFARFTGIKSRIRQCPGCQDFSTVRLEFHIIFHMFTEAVPVKHIHFILRVRCRSVEAHRLQRLV